MKLLLFYAPSFWFKTYQKVLEQVEDQELEASCEEAVVVFYHIEVGGNENPEIDSKSDHTYIADGISVHNCSVQWSECSVCNNKAVTEDEAERNECNRGVETSHGRQANRESRARNEQG